MTKKMIYIFILLTLFTSCAGSQSRTKAEPSEISSEEIDLNYHNELRDRWFSSEVRSYRMTISYNLFSPWRGLWDITVQNGELVHWQFKDNINEEKHRTQASMFLQENLYELAESAYDVPGVHKIVVLYDPKGYIKHVAKQIRQDYPGDKPKDTGFSIKITDFACIPEKE